MTWNAVAGATGYNVQVAGRASVACSSPACTLTGLTNGQPVTVTVSATNTVGESADSAPVTATPVGPPAAPTALTATARDGKVDLSWTAPPGPVSSYTVLYGTSDSGGLPSSPGATTLSGLSGTTTTVTGLTDGTLYYFVVAAVNSNGAGPYSVEASATPLPPPAAPTGLSAASGIHQVTLSWTAATGAATYSVYRSASSGTEQAPALATGVTGTAFTDRNAPDGVPSFYTVTAVNSAGESGFSNEASATPPKEVLAINAGGGAAGTFSADTDFSGGGEGVDSDVVDTSGVSGAIPQAVFDSERFGTSTYTLPNLTPGGSYLLRLDFAEIYWKSAGQRLFDVSVNGQTVLSRFDIVSAAGGADKAVAEDFPVTADGSGNVTVVFTTELDNAKISALELLQAVAPDPQVSVTVGGLGDVYVGVPATSAATASVDHLPGGYQASDLTAHWSYSTTYIVYSATGNDETWSDATDGTTAAVTLNGADSDPTGTFSGTFMTEGFYEVAIKASVTYHVNATGKDLGPYFAYAFVDNGGAGSSAAPAAAGSGMAGQTAHELSAHQAPAGGPTTTGQKAVTVLADPLIVKVNDTSDSKDDKYVRLKSSHPAGRLFATPVTIVNSNDTAVTVKVTNPDSRLGFATTANPTADATSLLLTLPANVGTTFYITGEAQSSKIGDAEIDVSSSSGTPVYAKKMVTVFWFRGPSDVGGFGRPSTRVGGDMNLAVGQSYQIQQHVTVTLQKDVTANLDAFTAGSLGDNCISMTAAVTLMPDGVNLTSPQIMPLRLGIEQNGTHRVDVYKYVPVIQWTVQNPPTGLKTQPVVKEQDFTSTSANRAAGVWLNDSLSNTAEPFYTRAAMGSNTGLVSVDKPSTAADNVSAFVPDTLPQQVKAYDVNGNVVGTVTYQLSNANINTSFRDWCTIGDDFNATKGQTEWLSEASWGVNVSVGDSATVTTQNVIPPPDDPTEDGPLCTTPQNQDPQTKQDLGKATFTYPNVTPDP